MTTPELNTAGKEIKAQIKELKMKELRAILRWILGNQPYDAFHSGESGRKTRQGRIWLEHRYLDEPYLLVNIDECSPFDNQQELFEEMFEGDFSSDKNIKITGLK